MIEKDNTPYEPPPYVDVDDEDSNFVTFAHDELEWAGLFSKDSDYGGMIGNAVMELIRVFSKQGHSGFSAQIVSHIFHDLCQWKPLTPLSNDPDEWMEVGYDLWQSRRSPSTFSTDGGLTYYNLDDDSRVTYTSPERDKNEAV